MSAGHSMNKRGEQITHQAVRAETNRVSRADCVNGRAGFESQQQAAYTLTAPG